MGCRSGLDEPLGLGHAHDVHAHGSVLRVDLLLRVEDLADARDLAVWVDEGGAIADDEDLSGRGGVLGDGGLVDLEDGAFHAEVSGHPDDEEPVHLLHRLQEVLITLADGLFLRPSAVIPVDGHLGYLVGPHAVGFRVERQALGLHDALVLED